MTKRRTEVDVTRGPDTTREYRTRNGDRVILREFVPRNSLGEIVTFPVKGTVHHRGYARKKTAQIWTLEGRAMTHQPHPHDLVDMPPVLRADPPPCLDCVGISF